MNVIAAAAANGSDGVGSQRRARNGASRSHALVVDIQLAARRRGVPHAASLRRWAQAAYHAAVERKPAAAPAVTIRIIDSTESRRLNRTWRAKDKPTNVLSFPSMAASKPASREAVELVRPAAYRLQPAAWIDRSSIHLGDIAICAPVVAREAREQHKAPQAHWAHMVVHGILHLVGYDHENDRDAKVMEARETKLLMQFGYSDPYRTYV